jgi:hypothetical protein
VRIVEFIGIAVFILLVALAVLFFRRGFLARRGGTIELSVRLTTMVPGRGWSAGLGRFVGGDLRWYRIFSFSFRPRRVIPRRGLAVERRRTPEGPETLVLPSDWVIVRCIGPQAPVEIAMAEPTLTGFLSWVEAGPPSSAPDSPHSSRYRAS